LFVVLPAVHPQNSSAVALPPDTRKCDNYTFLIFVYAHIQTEMEWFILRESDAEKLGSSTST